jgi:hypothetical protein
MTPSEPRKILSLLLTYPQDSPTPATEDIFYACREVPRSARQDPRCLQLPRGRFDIQRLLTQLPAHWQPDLICLSSSLAQTYNAPIPTGLKQLSCPSVLKLYDSHYPGSQLQRLVAYAKAVDCTHNYVIYDRHHLHFYQEAGLSNLFWMPSSLSIPNVSVSPVQENHKQHDVIFCGSVGNIHPYRSYLLKRLQASDIDIKITPSTYTESFQTYFEWLFQQIGAAKIVFNCSMNGDSNRRTFEVLMAGGFLLTDRLSVESGLSLLFQEGVHLEYYGCEQELVDKIQYYRAHPTKAAEIARQGHAQFMQHYQPQALQDLFYRFLIDRQPLLDLYSVNTDPRGTPLPQSNPLSQEFRDRISLYEFLQEIHWLNPHVSVLYYQAKNQALVADLKDLPRLTLVVADSVELLKQSGQKFDIVLVDQNSDLEIIKALDPYIPVNGLLILLGTRNIDTMFKKYLATTHFRALPVANYFEINFSTWKRCSLGIMHHSSDPIQVGLDTMLQTPRLKLGANLKRSLKRQLTKVAKLRP